MDQSSGPSKYQHTATQLWKLDPQIIRNHLATSPSCQNRSQLYRLSPQQMAKSTKDEPKAVCCLDSPLFGSPEDPGTGFKLQLYPTGGPNDVGPTDAKLCCFGSLYVTLVDCKVSSVQAQVTVRVPNGMRNSEEVLMIEGLLGKSPTGRHQILGWANHFIWIENMLRLYAHSSDDFAISCSITYRRSTVEYSGHQLTADLKKLRHACPFSDFILQVGQAEFPVHRSLLSVRSPVFEAMLSFGSESKEMKEGKMVIDDVSAEIMQIFLDYLYFGELGDGVEEEMLMELLEVADKYDISSLVSLCLERLLARLSVSNAARIYALTYAHSLGTANRSARRFIVLHPVEVMATQGWTAAIRDNASLLEPLYADLAREREMINKLID